MWVILALLTAALTAAREALVKAGMQDGDEPAMVLAWSVVSALLLAPVALLIGRPPAGTSFWTAVAVSGTINAVAGLLIARAVHRSDLSLIAPLQSLTPLFMLATGPLILGELPGPLGGLGIALIVAGAWLLRSPERSRGVLEPFRAILRDEGARLMLIVAFLYSISASFDKVGVQASHPLTWGAALHAFVALAIAPIALWRARRAGRALLPGRPAYALGAGVAMALSVATQMTALTLTLAAYVIAVKRTSTVMGVAIGHLLFREAGLRERLPAALVMLAGFLLVTIG